MSERLDRIESTLESIGAALMETRAICDSNARAIAANSAAIAAIDERVEARMANLTDVMQQAINAMQEGQAETSHQMQSLIDIQQENSQVHAAFMVRMEENSQEHSAFRELIQGLFSEVQRIWQRLAS